MTDSITNHQKTLQITGRKYTINHHQVVQKVKEQNVSNRHVTPCKFIVLLLRVHRVPNMD